MPAYVVGRNEDGQAGVGTSADISTPALVSSLSNSLLRSLASGSGHALFLTEDGGVYAAGRGDDGRLGIAPSMPNASIGWVQTPTRVLLSHEGESEADAKRRKAIYVAAGSYHTMIIDMDGKLWASGGCLYGKLGLGEGVSSPVPRQIQAFGTRRVLQVACGSRHTIALVAEPGVFPSLSSRSTAAAAGDIDTTSGEHESEEQPGGSSSRDQYVVVRRGGGAGKTSRSSTQREDTQDSADALDGSYSTASSAVTDTAYQWHPESKSGVRTSGASGTPESRGSATPHSESGRGPRGSGQRSSPLATLAAVLNMSVSSMMGSPTSASSASPSSRSVSAADRSRERRDGTGQSRRVPTPVSGEGSTSNTNLGQSSSTRSLPARLSTTASRNAPSGAGVSTQSPSNRPAQSMMPSTSLWAWGSCDKGVLGLGDESMLHRYPIAPTAGGSFCLPEPQKLPPFTAPPTSTSAPAGASQSASVGDSENAPVEIVQVAACGFHNLALDYHGRVYSWGEGRFGRLGTGYERDVWVPTPIAQHLIPESVIHVAAGGFHSIAVTEDGSAYVFGGNEHGQCGTGSTSNLLLPVRLTTLSDKIIVSAAAGWSHSLFLTNEGTVYSTGNSEHGKLGYTPARGQYGVGPPAAGSGLCQLLPRQVDALTGQTITYVSSYNETSFFLTAPCGTNTLPGTLSASQGVGSLLSLWSRRDAEQLRLRAKDIVASQSSVAEAVGEHGHIPPFFHSQWRAHMEYYKSARDSGRYYASPTASALASTPRMAASGPLTPLSLPSPMMSPPPTMPGTGQTPVAGASGGGGYLSPLPPAALPSGRQPSSAMQRESSMRSMFTPPPPLSRLSTTLSDQAQQSPRVSATTPSSASAGASVLQGMSVRAPDQRTPTPAATTATTTPPMGAATPLEIDTSGLGTPRAGSTYYEFIPHPSGQGGILSPYTPPLAAPPSASAFPGTPIRGGVMGEMTPVQGPSTPLAVSTPSAAPPTGGLMVAPFFTSPSQQPPSRVSTPVSTSGLSHRGTPVVQQRQVKQQPTRPVFPSKSRGFGSLNLDLSVLVDNIHYFPDIVLTFPGDEPESLMDSVIAHRKTMGPTGTSVPTQNTSEGTRSGPFASQLDYTAEIPGSNYFQEPEISTLDERYYVEPFLVGHKSILCVRCPPLAAMIFSSSEAAQKRHQKTRNRRYLKRMRLQRRHTSLKKQLQGFTEAGQPQGETKQTVALDQGDTPATSGTGTSSVQRRGSQTDSSAVHAVRREEEEAGSPSPALAGTGASPSRPAQAVRRHFFPEDMPDVSIASSPSGHGTHAGIGMSSGTTTDADSELRAQAEVTGSPFALASPALHQTPRGRRYDAPFASEEVDADDLFSDVYFDKLEEEEKALQMQSTPMASQQGTTVGEFGTGHEQTPTQGGEASDFMSPSGADATEDTGIALTAESGDPGDAEGYPSVMTSEDESDSDLWAAFEEDEDVHENPMYRDLLTVLNLPSDTTVLQLPDTRKDTFRIFLYYLYTDSLPPEMLNIPSHIWNFASQEQKPSEDETQERPEGQDSEPYIVKEADDMEPKDFMIPLEIALLIDVSALAERFVSDKLAILCEQLIMKHIQANTAPLLLTAADSMSATRLRRRIIYYIADNDRFDTISSSKTFVDVLDRDLILEILSIRSDQHARMKAATPTHAEVM